MGKIPGLNESTGKMFPDVVTGTYHVRVEGLEYVESQGEKTREQRYIKLTLAITDQNEEHVGSKLWWTHMWPTDEDDNVYDINSDDLTRRVAGVKMLQLAAGCAGDDDFEEDDIQGAEFRVEVRQEAKKDMVTKKIIPGQFNSIVKTLLYEEE